MDHRESSEMYLETIYLLEQEHGHARGVGIAERLNVSKASVTKAVKKLKAEGCLRHEAYGSIMLTPKGKKLSESIYFKHQMISTFLSHSLGVSKFEADRNACKMEHILTDEVLDAMNSFNVRNGVENEI